jgi:hypothetical protein
MSSDRFWSMIDALRAVASPYALDFERANVVLEGYSEQDRSAFTSELLKLLKEGERWDVWAVGAILHGKLGLRFCRHYVLWVILQGKSFCERVFRDPLVGAERVSADDPSSEFDIEAIGAGAADATLTGRRWNWRELPSLHPGLWERYFVRRDRRPPWPEKSSEDLKLVCDAEAPLEEWGDIYSDPDYLLTQYERLSPDQVGLHAACWWKVEYDNGGMDQFFRNSTGVLAREAVSGLERFGLPKYAALLRKATELFPGKGPARDRRERVAQMDSLWPDQDFDSVLGLSEPDEVFENAIARYIRAHPSAFFRSR